MAFTANKECKRTGICQHNRQKKQCKECKGSGICQHNRRRVQCKECGGSQFCPHNRIKSRCKECGGSGICPHNRIKSSCRYCGGSQFCPHNRIKSKCNACGGSSMCSHNRQKADCKECKGSSICQHNIRKTRCKECAGASICQHNRVRCQCKECHGSSVCEHNRRRAHCKECHGSAFCQHNRVRNTCKICNVNHPYYGIEDHHGRASKFEHVMIMKLNSALPPLASLTEQFPIPNPFRLDSKHPFRLDVVVTLNTSFRFVVEFDGSDHYTDGCRKTLRDPVTQMKRDRYVEKWALDNNMSIFRVPYTCRTQKRATAAMNYILNAAAQDQLHEKTQVHYLDYENTYISIDEFAFNTEGVDFIIAHPSSHCSSVYTRSK